MQIFISGGVRSGKTSLGEKLAIFLAGKSRKIYLATSRYYDAEMTKRIQIHQQKRANKGFISIDKNLNIGEVTDHLKSEDTVLVDCLGTLLANEMFDRVEGLTETGFNSSALIRPESIRDKIFDDLLKIRNKVANLIIISNDVFSDGFIYNQTTEMYILTLAQLHIKLVQVSDIAIECVYSSYQCHKGELLIK